jgi:hypothetical protein
MSACISRHGEFGSHDLDADYVCKLCAVLDEEALIAEMNRLRADAEAHRQTGYVRAIADVHARIAREVRSTAKRVPTDYRERAGYRAGLRAVWEILADLLEQTK